MEPTVQLTQCPDATSVHIWWSVSERFHLYHSLSLCPEHFWSSEWGLSRCVQSPWCLSVWSHCKHADQICYIFKENQHTISYVVYWMKLFYKLNENFVIWLLFDVLLFFLRTKDTWCQWQVLWSYSLVWSFWWYAVRFLQSFLCPQSWTGRSHSQPDSPRSERKWK